VSTERFQAALEDFRSRHPRDSSRQREIQRFCVEELAKRGIVGAGVEVALPGAYRAKVWDVGLLDVNLISQEPQLAISCKSIISNHAGTVPNRIDDLLGEAVNLHRRFPKAVIGYLFMMSRIDESKAARERREKLAATMSEEAILEAARANGDAWFAQLGESVSRAAGRDKVDELPERFEAVSCSLFDFDQPPPFPVQYHPQTDEPKDFFDRLVAIHQERFTAS
jgi:hypothetical protein